MVLKNVQYSSPCGLAAQVDTTVRSAFVALYDHLLIQFVDIDAGFPACSSMATQCLLTSGTLTWNFKAADSV